MWWTLPMGETILSTQVYNGWLIIVSTSMVWYVNQQGQLAPMEVICPAPTTPTLPTPVAAPVGNNAT